MRYEYKHSILGYNDSKWGDTPLVPGHRVSFMVRVSCCSRRVADARTRRPSRNMTPYT